MPLTVNNLIQCTDSQSPDSSSASMRDQKETLLFDIQRPDGKPYVFSNSSDLNKLESLILGNVSDDIQGLTTFLGLRRTLPLSHPLRSGFYASSRSMLEGAGVPAPAPDFNGILNLPPLSPNVPPALIIYPNYRISVDFTHRLYNVWPDDYISAYEGEWYDDSNKLQQFIYVDEWMRFTDVELKPKDDWISYTLGGQMAFKVDVSPLPFANGKQYSQMPRIRMPNSSLKITWYQAPYRFVTSPNSYLEKYKGRINQNAWWRWLAGSLLFVNYNPIRYQQPNPNKVATYGINPIVGNFDPPPTKYPNLSWAQTCDIELEFILTNREVQPNEVSTATNLHSVVGGHNLLPWGSDRKFHYAETVDSPHESFWQSAPFEILFSDPDFIQTGV